MLNINSQEVPRLKYDLEPNINLKREFDAVRKRRHLEQQCRESRGEEDVWKEEVQKEGIGTEIG